MFEEKEWWNEKKKRLWNYLNRLTSDHVDGKAPTRQVATASMGSCTFETEVRLLLMVVVLFTNSCERSRSLDTGR